MQALSDALAESDDRPDMTPLIDCMMVMLLFFIVTTTFSASSAFEAELPKTTSATLIATDEAVVVTVGRDGAFAVGDAACAPGELVARIKAGLAAGPRPVVVRGDAQAPYVRITEAVDAAHAAGASSWALAVEQ